MKSRNRKNGLIKRVMSWMLALVMVISLAPTGFGAKKVMAADAYDLTVHYSNQDGWTEVYGYAWTDAGANLAGAWPGTQVSENAEHAGWYDLVLTDVTTDTVNFIFNNNAGSQTGNLSSIARSTELWCVGEIVTDQECWDGVVASTSLTVGDLVQVKVGDTLTTMDIYMNGVYETPVTGTGDMEAVLYVNGEATDITATGTAAEGENKVWRVVDGRLSMVAVEPAALVGNFTGLDFVDENGESYVIAAWDPTDPNAELTYVGGGLYERTFKFVELAEDLTIADTGYKVAFNDSWDYSIGVGSGVGAGNVSLTLPAGSTSLTVVVDRVNEVLYDSVNTDAEPIGFTIGRDNNLFANSSEDFFANSTTNNYSVNSNSYRSALYKDQDENFYELLLEKEFENWMGSCYGISASIMYAYYDSYDITKYMDEIMLDYPYYYSVRKPVNDSDLKDLIQVFQLSQYRSDMTYTDTTNNSFSYKKFGIGSDIKTLLKGIVEEAEKSNYFKPFLLGVTYKNSGHALVVCGSEGKTNGYYKIAICDPNGSPVFHEATNEMVSYHNKYSYLMIKTDYSEFHMENEEGTTIYSGEIDSDSFKELKYVTYEDAYSKASSEKLVDCEVIVNVASSFYMTTDVGTYLSYDGEKFTGTADIDNATSVMNLSDGDEGASWIIELPGVNEVNFSNMSENMEVDCLFDSDEYINVTGTDMTSLSFGDDKGVSIEGTNGTYTVSIGAKDDNNTLIQASGEVTGSVSYEYDDENIKVDGVEDISNITINKLTEDGIQKLDKTSDPTVSIGDDNIASTITGIIINSSSSSLSVGDTTELTVRVEPSAVTGYTLNWISSNNEVATVDASGVVTAKSVGCAMITVSCGDVAASMNITVTESLNNAVISSISDQKYTGNEVKPVITVTLNGEVVNENNYSVIYINNVNEGTATVTVTGKGYYEGKVTSTFKIVKTLPYTDVPNGAWYYEYVYDVYEKRLMTGMNVTTFGPAVNLSRAQFATILYRMENSPEVTYSEKFPDVANGQFFTSPVLWACENGVVTGYGNGTFGPADNITREQMAVMLFRYANYKDYDTSARADISNYPDADKVSFFAKDAMEWCVAEGIISGDGGKLNPQGNTVRAVCATIISRFVRSYE